MIGGELFLGIDDHSFIRHQEMVNSVSEGLCVPMLSAGYS